MIRFDPDFAIGAAMEVHKILGNGFQEVIYQRALEIELAQNGLTFEREYEMDIYYKGERICGRRVDFFVEGEIMVELKAGKPSESRNKKSSKSH
jgi:GxxExxY protein